MIFHVLTIFPGFFEGPFAHGVVKRGKDAGLLVVEGGLLIPFARSICVEIDPAAKRIAVELPEGLKELNRS